MFIRPIATHLFSLVLILSVVHPAWADTLHLKNGQTVEGILVEDTPQGVVLDLGFGTVDFKRDEIERLEKATPEHQKRIRQTQKSQFTSTKRQSLYRPAFAPAKLKPIALELDKLIRSRRIALRTQLRIARLKKELGKQAKAREELDLKLAEVGRDLQRLVLSTDREAYNQAVVAHNATITDIKVLVNEMMHTEETMREAYAKIQLYSREFNQFEHDLKSQVDAIKPEDSTEEDKRFLKSVADKLASLKLEFKQVDIAYAGGQGSTGVVAALINGRTQAQLVVDTGAALVLLSKDIVRELNLDLEAAREVQMVVADGSTVTGKQFLLESLEVGEMRAKNVRAAVIDDVSRADHDGLLGMSFLGQFNLQIDAANKRLVLHSFDPD